VGGGARAQEAAAQNERKRGAESAQAAFTRMQAAPAPPRAPPARVAELSPAEAAKEDGNAALKRGNLAQARRPQRTQDSARLASRGRLCPPARPGLHVEPQAYLQSARPRMARSGAGVHRHFAGRSAQQPVGRRVTAAQAEERYSAALALDAGLTAAANNRALARLRLGRWADAEADCSAVLTREPANVKALLRRGAARRAPCTA
jgi:hypothetical protein